MIAISYAGCIHGVLSKELPSEVLPGTAVQVVYCTKPRVAICTIVYVNSILCSSFSTQSAWLFVAVLSICSEVFKWKLVLFQL